MCLICPQEGCLRCKRSAIHKVECDMKESMPNWLGVRQLSFYATFLTVHKTLVHRIPEFLYENLTSGRRYEKRGTLRHIVERSRVGEFRLSIASSSFRWRGNCQHSKIPDSLKDEQKMPIFKIKLKLWVQKTVSIKY